MSTSASRPQSVTEAIKQRHSTRAFLPNKPVPQNILEEILGIAVRAPSGGNTQPWHLYVVTGEKKKDICQAVTEQAIQKSMGGGPSSDKSANNIEFLLYPPSKIAPASYQQRRRKLAYDMYGKMGIDRKDSVAKNEAMLRNYLFFDAPVGIIVTVDRVVDKNGWGHVGTLLMSICLLAEERGLGTCLQEAWGNQGALLYKSLGIDPSKEIIWCGIALGYADGQAKVNSLRSERQGIPDVVKFFGFPPTTLQEKEEISAAMTSKSKL